jgi:DNA replication protein DnaC
MTAFLKIDRCRVCQQDWPWEWVPPLILRGTPLAGTGVWRSALVDGCCTACADTIDRERKRASHARRLRAEFIHVVGGVKPYRAFTFERYRLTPGNRIAFQRAKEFEPSRDNLYLWGPCGLGKTHLAVAILRQWFARGASIELVTPFQLVRKLRMKTPEEEERAIGRLITVKALLLDDLGVGSDTAFARQLLQEILDGRDFKDRGGLVVTSQYSLSGLAVRFHDRSIPSRLAGMCRVVEMSGTDGRGRASTAQQ